MMLDDRNSLVDCKDVKGTLEAIIGLHLDHYMLNETLDESNVTAEYLAKWLYSRLAIIAGVALVYVTIWESPECSVTYTGGV